MNTVALSVTYRIQGRRIVIALTAINLVPSGLRDAPPSSLKCIGGGMENSFTTERSVMFRNRTWKRFVLVTVEEH